MCVRKSDIIFYIEPLVKISQTRGRQFKTELFQMHDLERGFAFVVKQDLCLGESINTRLAFSVVVFPT